jgi:hypothetical protein
MFIVLMVEENANTCGKVLFAAKRCHALDEVMPSAKLYLIRLEEK